MRSWGSVPNPTKIKILLIRRVNLEQTSRLLSKESSLKKQESMLPKNIHKQFLSMAEHSQHKTAI